MLPLQQVPLETVATPEEEIASSRLSLEEAIDKFHFEEEENPGALVVNISDETDRHSGVHTPTLVIACPNSTSEEEEDGMALNWGNKSLRGVNFERSHQIPTSTHTSSSFSFTSHRPRIESHS